MSVFARFFAASLLLCSLFTACEKEYSLEAPGSVVIVGGGSSEGTLGGNPGDCANAALSGIIGAGIPLSDSNKLSIEVTFTKTGTFYISTDTVNGVYFAKSGAVTATGLTTIVLTGSGTPTTAGDYAFIITFKATACSVLFSVYQTPAATGTDYFPTTPGSFWSYRASDPTAPVSDTLYTFSTGSDFVVNGNTYSLLSSRSGPDTLPVYVSKANGEYHRYGDLDLTGFADSAVFSDYIFLKDNVPAGTEWFSSEGNALVNGVPAKVRLKFTVSAKDVIVEVGGNAYQNVIKVITAQQFQLPQGADWQTPVLIENWYAKGIGLVNIAVPALSYGYEVKNFTVF